MRHHILLLNKERHQRPLKSRASAANQKVQVGGNLLTMAKTYFPDTAAAAIDERKTIENFKKLMKDEVVELRNETQTADLLNTVLGVAQQAGVVPGRGGQ
ncbi:hypothetical protein [Rhizobium chutanense]|uniref:hypothetical protein n=1 Tax=Rhizobium chutanense TaxID=2035448 RepID=UPI0015CF344B|nr:hypothetical protein [Rhizobium chutanense]